MAKKITKKLTPEQDALNRACGIFACSDNEESPSDQYDKLKKAMEDGNGDDFAISHALVWSAVEYLTVEQIVEQIEGLQENFLEFLKSHTK